MTATNHALTGAIIGLTAVNPLPAVLLAFVSHYFLDIMPHFGLPEKNETKLKSVWFRNYLLVEASLCFLIVLTLFLRQPTHWWLGALCAFAAA